MNITISAKWCMDVEELTLSHCKYYTYKNLKHLVFDEGSATCLISSEAENCRYFFCYKNRIFNEGIKIWKSIEEKISVSPITLNASSFLLLVINSSKEDVEGNTPLDVLLDYFPQEAKSYEKRIEEARNQFFLDIMSYTNEQKEKHIDNEVYYLSQYLE